MNYRPVYGNILVQEIEGKDDIVVPQDSTSQIRAKVVAVSYQEPSANTSTGDWVKREVNPGAIIHFNYNDAKKIKLDDIDYFIIRERDVLVVEQK